MRVPRGAFHWRVERNGYVPADLVTGTPGNSLRFNLQADNAPHRDVFRIPGGEVRLWVLGGVSAAHSVSLGAFLIDRREVTNREFAKFADAGGCTREEFWKHPFRDGARSRP